MELPVIDMNSADEPAALLRAAFRSEIVLARTFSTETAIEGATVFTCRQMRGDESANFATHLDVGAEGGEAELLKRIQVHAKEMGCRCMGLRPYDTPRLAEGFAQAAREAGYRPHRWQLMRMERYERPAGLCEGLQIIPARAATAELRKLLEARGAGAAMSELDEPRLDHFVGRLDGRVVGQAGILALGEVGFVTNVEVVAEVRGQGIAKALLDHVMDLAGRAKFRSVILAVGRENEVARGLYEKIGMRVVLEAESLVLPVENGEV